MSLSDPFNGTMAAQLDAMGVPYSLYDVPGLYSQDDAYVRPGAFDGGQVPVWDGQQFKLVQGTGKKQKVLYSGTGIEGLNEATRLSQELGSGWKILSNLPSQDQDAGVVNEMFASNNPAGISYGGKSKTDFDPAILLPALPFLAAVAAPALGGLAAGSGGGAAGAGTAAAGASGATGAAGGLAAGAGGLGAGGGFAAALPAFEGITVLGAGGAGIGSGLTAGLAGAGALGGLAAGNLSNATAGAQPSGTNYGDQIYNPNSDIVVQGATGGAPLDLAVAPDLAALGASTTGALTASPSVAETPPAKSTIDKIVDYLQLGALGTGLLGNLFGGGGSSTEAGTIPGGLNGDLNPIFSAQLPTADIPGVGPASNLGARQMPDQDWTRYAMRPGQSFFNYVPQTYTPPPPGQIDPRWDSLAAGGSLAARMKGTS